MTTSSIFFFLVRFFYAQKTSLLKAQTTHTHTDDTHLCENKASKSDHKNARVHFFSLLVVLL